MLLVRWDCYAHRLTSDLWRARPLHSITGSGYWRHFSRPRPHCPGFGSIRGCVRPESKVPTRAEVLIVILIAALKRCATQRVAIPCDVWFRLYRESKILGASRESQNPHPSTSLRAGFLAKDARNGAPGCGLPVSLGGILIAALKRCATQKLSQKPHPKAKSKYPPFGFAEGMLSRA
jgi:hypothetical protein